MASGIAIAREITEIYNVFDTDQKLSFFKEVNKKFSPNPDEVEKKINTYIHEKSKKNLNSLGSSIEGQRQELIRRLNMAPNGTPFLVSMREDLLKFLPNNSDLKDLDEDIRNEFVNEDRNNRPIRLKKMRSGVKIGAMDICSRPSLKT